MTVFARLAIALVALLLVAPSAASAQEPDDQLEPATVADGNDGPADNPAPQRTQAEVISIEIPQPGILDVAFVVPDVARGETPTATVEADVPYEGLQVQALDAAPTVVVAFDTSGSMDGSRLVAAKEAASSCVGLLPQGTRVALVSFATTVRLEAIPSTDRVPVTDAIARLVAEGDTATLDAVIAGTEVGLIGADAQDSNAASQFIVLVTDGEDTASSATLDDAAVALESSDFRLYALGVDLERDGLEKLEQLTTATRGLLLTGAADELAELCSGVVDRIAGRYRLVMNFAGEVPPEIILNLEFNGVGARLQVNVTGVGDDEEQATNSQASADQQVASDEPAEPAPTGAADAEPVEIEAPELDVDEGREFAGALPDVVDEGRELAGALPNDVDDDPPIEVAPAVPLPPPPPPSQRNLWLGAALVVGAPLLLFRTLLSKKRLPQGLRIRSRPTLGPVARLSALTSRLLERSRHDRKIDQQLDQASLSIRAGEFVVFVALAALLPALALVILGLSLSALAVLLGVPVVAWVAVTRRGRKRADDFHNQLGDTLMTLSSSLRAGSSPLQALRIAAEKSPSPTAEEFQRVVAETRLGRELTASLQDLANRVKSEDVQWLVEAIALNNELGGNLASTLDNVGETVLARAKVKSQVRVMSAEGRLTAAILLGLPFAIALILQFLNPGYLQPLVTTGSGNLILGIALANMALGAFWVSRLIKLEY